MTAMVWVGLSLAIKLSIKPNLYLMKLNLFTWDTCLDFVQIAYKSEDLNRNELVLFDANPLKLALNLQAMLGEKALNWSKAEKLANKIIAKPNRIS